MKKTNSNANEIMKARRDAEQFVARLEAMLACLPDARRKLGEQLLNEMFDAIAAKHIDGVRHGPT